MKEDRASIVKSVVLRVKKDAWNAPVTLVGWMARRLARGTREVGWLGVEGGVGGDAGARRGLWRSPPLPDRRPIAGLVEGTRAGAWRRAWASFGAAGGGGAEKNWFEVVGALRMC